MARAEEGSTQGNLLPLKTLHECQLADKTWEIYVVVVPSDLGEQAVKTINAGIPTLKGSDTAHLKRFVRAEDIPAGVRPLFPTACLQRSEPQEQMRGLKKKQAAKKSDPLFMVACPTTYISLEGLAKLLSSNLTSLSSDPQIRSISVPKYAPTSYEKSVAWTRSHWKTVYKQTNPFGPHPSRLTRAQNEIAVDIDQHMSLARSCASTVKNASVGEAVGCVVVQRDWHGSGTVVVAAGDARYFHHRPGSSSQQGCSEGNAMAHAAMRAIGMVGRKRQEAATQPDEQPDEDPAIHCVLCAAKDLDQYFHCDICLSGTYNLCAGCYGAGVRCWENQCHDLVRRTAEKPRTESDVDATPTEHLSWDAFDRQDYDYFMDRPLPKSPESLPKRHQARLDRNGYLCHNMEIYLTHEPCVMCSMAIVHSRFGRVVFDRRMPHTGGLTAEKEGQNQGLGHGLFWRKKLNWTMLAWELARAEDDVDASVGQDVHV